MKRKIGALALVLSVSMLQASNMLITVHNSSSYTITVNGAAIEAGNDIEMAMHGAVRVGMRSEQWHVSLAPGVTKIVIYDMGNNAIMVQQFDEFHNVIKNDQFTFESTLNTGRRSGVVSFV